MSDTRYEEAKIRATAAQVLADLAAKGGKLPGTDLIAHHSGQQIMLPEGMTAMVGAQRLFKLAEDDEQTYEISREFPYLPHDVARAVAQAIRNRFGYTMGAPTAGFFNSRPPELITIDTNYNAREQVPWGWMELPYFEDGMLHVGPHKDPSLGLVGRVQIRCKRRDAASADGLFGDIEDFLYADSIYRGKAITASEEPTFLDLTGFEPRDVVYTQDVIDLLNVHLWVDIDYPQAIRDAGQDTKRVIIVSGVWGVGKTKAGEYTGWKLIVEKGPRGTFIPVRPGIDNWRYAMTLAAKYSTPEFPAIIFLEDIDLLITQNNSHELSMVMDAFDGLVSKGINVRMLATTNYIERVQKGMLRPGRTDGWIIIGNMDRDGVEKLTRRVVGSELSVTVDFDIFFDHVADYTPAYIREVLNRVIRWSIYNNGGRLGLITTEDLVGAARELRPQLELMNAAPEVKRVERGDLDEMWTQMIKDAVDEQIEHRINGATINLEDGDGDNQLYGSLSTN